MDEELSKAEITKLASLISAISIKDFRTLLLDYVMGAFKLSHKNTNVEFNFGRSRPDQNALDYLQERVFVLSDKTASRLTGDLRFQLLEGLKNNESIDTITKRLDTIFEGNTVNTERIARTEILNAQNSGRLSAYAASGVVEYKMWIAAINNARTAADSKRLHGQIQKISDPFVDPKTGESFMHPPNRPQCRCTTVPLTRLPDNVITISGQMYAADKKIGKIELPTIEISRILLKSQQKKKAWVVQWANGRAVTCFEDEADADYYIETSKKKDAGWFDFGGKVYREVESGWSVKKKGTKITFKTNGESRKVNKVEFDVGSLNKREITVKGFYDKRGVWHPSHKRMIKDVTPKEVAPKEVSVEVVEMEEKPITTMTPENLKELKSFEELGMMGGLHEPGSYRAKFNDNANAMYKVMIKGAIVGEVSTYDVSKILDWDVVPETIETNFEDKGDGSCQKWVDGGNTPYEGFGDEHKDHVKIEQKHFNDLAKIYVLDMVTGNYDRHGGNVMIDENDHCWAIDNEDWGTPGAADDFMTALDDRAEVSDVGGFSPMIRWLDRNFEITDYSIFRKEIIKNMNYIVKNKNKIINYYDEYKDADFTVGEEGDEKPITLILLSIKENLDYIEKYCGENK